MKMQFPSYLLLLSSVVPLAACDGGSSDTGSGGSSTGGSAESGSDDTVEVTGATSGTTSGPEGTDSEGPTTEATTEASSDDGETTEGPQGFSVEVDIQDDVSTDFSDVYLMTTVVKEQLDFYFDDVTFDFGFNVTNTVLFQDVVAVQGAGPIQVILPELPPGALEPSDCADANLGDVDGAPLDFCDEQPDDRYAQVTFRVFRDGNGNGMMDQVSPEATEFADEILALHPVPTSSLFYVEEFTSEAIRASGLGVGYGFFDDAAFEPGWHTIGMRESQELCSDVRFVGEEACHLRVETPCLDAGGDPNDCNADFIECFYPVTPEQFEACERPVDQADTTFEMPLAEPSVNVNIRAMCEVSVEPFSTTCDPAITIPSVPPEDSCSADGVSYDLTGVHPYDPATALCTPEHECFGTVALPTDAIPADWPCTVTVSLQGEPCGAGCHPALTCQAGQCA